ncbi:MAG TPA: cyclic nucleotide-binding domain-containing protein [Myxococcales bacterium]|nr:cyclic nucleotide-binding domain-containing protein [Myxococcales bacterium]
MAKKTQIDVRKLKDEVAEHLKKARWEKAAEVLEQLVGAEPKDVAQRLKLGDTYRRINQKEKAIGAYQHAARFFADEGQLIKAIGAVKMILDVDPKNAAAQKQLAEMNERRLGKVSLAPSGVRPKPPTPRPEEPPPGGHGIPKEIELPPGGDEPLELDDGMGAPRKKPAAIAPPPPPPAAAAPRTPPPPRREIEVELDPALPPAELAEPEMLPEDAILTPQAEDLVAREQDEEVISGEEFGREGGPIADLLSPSGAEEEIELLSISADEQAAGPRPIEAPSLTAGDTDVERAFDSVAPPSRPVAPPVPAKKVPLFDDLSQEAFVALVNRLGYQRHAPGDLIIREGDPGRSFYIIVEGRVRIYKTGPDLKEITLAHLGEGAFFGEMALLSGAPRTANVAAEEETGILEVTDTVLRELASRYPQVVTSLKNFYRQRLLNNVMAISPLFKDFDPSERKAIVEKFRMRQAGPGEALIEQGKGSDGLYVVLHGGVQVMAQDIELARLKEGDIFGEMSLLTREPAAATVRADGNAILLRLPRENFQELVLTHPQILALVSELTEQRRTAIEAILHGQGEGHDGMSFL